MASPSRTLRVVVPSADPRNLVACISALLRSEPGLDPSQITVVDDGARAEAAARLPDALRWVPGVRPFVYARNVNRGLDGAPGHVVILGDDVQLETPGGLAALERRAQTDPALGIVAAAVRGAVGNPRQRAGGSPPFRREPDMVAFVCVLVTAACRAAVGGLDERFTGYGFDDADYCWRARRAGFGLGIEGACVVEHEALPSSYRTRADFRPLNRANQDRMLAKWGALPTHGVARHPASEGAG